MKTPTVVVVADDLSGASSAGGEFARTGLSTVIVQTLDALHQEAERVDALIFDTESRYDPPEVAREKCIAVGRLLKQIGAPLLLKKFDSLLRGPIGQEIDGVMESAGFQRCLFISAAPRMGRITVGGYQLVDGLPLAQRLRQLDPSESSGSSFIPERLAAQTRRPVLRLDTRVLTLGEPALKRFFAETGPGIIVADSATQSDINMVVAAAYSAGIRCFAGSYGLGEALRAVAGSLDKSAPVLMVAGSTSEMTRRQVARLEATLDAQSVVLDLDTGFFRAPLAEFAAPYVARLQAGHDILLHTTASHDAYDAVRRLAATHGVKDSELALRVDLLVQHLVAPFLDRCKAFVFSGGNTAQAVYQLLNAKGLTIFGQEVLPGTPVARVREGPFDGRLFLTKPGSFGTADDLAIMLNFVKHAPSGEQ